MQRMFCSERRKFCFCKREQYQNAVTFHIWEKFCMYSEKLSFNFSIIEAYKSIAGVQVVEIDANQYKNNVMKQIQEAIQHLI